MKYSDPNVRPTPVRPDLSSVPEELRGIRQWCLWKYSYRDNSWTKVPYSPAGKPASSTNSETWATFKECVEVVDQYDGVGFVFSKDTPYIGIDLDSCVLDKGDSFELTPFASDIVERFDTYCELSPSQTGLHLIGKAGNLDAAKGAVDGNAVEVYRSGRYFTFTGLSFDDEPKPINNVDMKAKRLIDAVRANSKSASTHEPKVLAAKAAGPVDERIKEALKDEHIRRLFDGDTGEYDNDDSRADLALCSKLVPYAGGDPVVLDRMFRESKLYREKWDTLRGADTYGALTVAKSLEGYVVEDPRVLRRKNRHTIDSLWDSVLSYRENGDARGVSPGWNELEKYYRPAPGLMTVLGGTPSSGKSTWMDALAYNLAKLHDWKISFASFESLPIQRHILSLCQIHLQKPTFIFSDGHATDREMERARAEIGEWFSFIMPEDEETDIDSLLEYVNDDYEELGIDGFVIDPFTEVELRRGTNLSEVEAIKQALKKLQQFTRRRMLHSWILAHPTKNGADTYVQAADGTMRPSMYSLAGAAHFANKADFGILIHRQQDNKVGIYVDKVRNAESTGGRGSVVFEYDPSKRLYTPVAEDTW